MLSALLERDVQDWIIRHENDDTAALALRQFPFDPQMRPLILGQIRARQKARRKMPSWFAAPGVIFPPADMLEQSSSDATARYKQSIAGTGNLLVDLTAGCGVDAAALSANFKKTVCVDADAMAVSYLSHNLPLMTKAGIGIIHACAEDYIKTMPRADLVFIDPQRRTGSSRGIFRLQECRPNLTSLLPPLQNKAGCILLKASPMLDIDSALDILPGVQDIHVLEWRRECKEVLYMIEAVNSRESPVIHAVILDDAGHAKHRFSFTRRQETGALAPLSMPQDYIYEPGPALMKAGCFSLIAARLGLSKLHPGTHLYTSERIDRNFPGRVFALEDTLRADRKAVLGALPGKRAHLKARNFPGQTSQDLQKKLGIEEGGDAQLFACTLMDDSHAILLCRPAPGG